MFSSVPRIGIGDDSFYRRFELGVSKLIRIVFVGVQFTALKMCTSKCVNSNYGMINFDMIAIDIEKCMTFILLEWIVYRLLQHW